MSSRPANGPTCRKIKWEGEKDDEGQLLKEDAKNAKARRWKEVMGYIGSKRNPHIIQEGKISPEDLMSMEDFIPGDWFFAPYEILPPSLKAKYPNGKLMYK